MKAAKECTNCYHWDGINDDASGECLESWRYTSPHDSCKEFKVEPARFCAICDSEVREGKNSVVFCIEDENHFASQWDYEWFNLK